MSSWAVRVIRVNEKAVKWLSADQLSAWQGFRKMTRALDARLARDLARDSGLSMQDYDVLSALTDAPHQRWSAKHLGGHLLWTASRLSHHIDRMEKRGLVRREPSAESRGSDVVLTPDGFDAIHAAAPEHAEAVRRSFINRLTPQELAVLARISDSVLAALEEQP